MLGGRAKAVRSERAGIFRTLNEMRLPAGSRKRTEEHQVKDDCKLDEEQN